MDSRTDSDAPFDPSAFDAVDVAVTAVAALAWTAVADVVQTPSQRRLARAGILALGGAVVGAKVAITDPEGDLARVREIRRAEMEGDGDRVLEIAAEQESADAGWSRHTEDLLGRVPERWRLPAIAAAGAGAVGLTVGSIALQQRIDDAAAAWFARRGVSRPYTAAGACWAVLTAATLPFLAD